VESLPADIYVGVGHGAMIGMNVPLTAPMTFGRPAFCANPSFVFSTQETDTLL